MKTPGARLGLTVLICWLLLAAAPGLAGDAAGGPAGAVLYTCTDQGVFLLLADHRPPSRRGWGSFGGRHEPGESPAETAARETEEETRGYFKRAAILAAIGDQQPAYDGFFTQYFVQVDDVPAEAIAKATASSNDRVYAERGPWAWIPYTEIRRLINSGHSAGLLRIDARYLPADAHTDWVWPTWLDSLRVAIEQGVLPWETQKVEAVAAEP
ncbi:MAG TPA: NUDIX domain-containing protein [Desulfobacteraceae bacterium]|nr:NUDIX domain-containing protein [Deltaproteobacteria bacterium]MBW2357080.1 NUDIX domain-containing protein [Deltaproteobacteria bacterium]RLB97793.1 MAG: hypothetical protein DRH76_04095 [Deltaproteobacteria bacterium]HDI59061.1 NUDIX domain-containing protein [Desulfobacteraceae bacterium]